MIKIRFKFALAFAPICILLLLAGCEREQPGAQTAALPPQANAVQEAAAQWAAVQETATDQPYTAAEEAAAEQLTWQEAYAVFLSELMQVTGLTWRQAYAAILRELAQVTVDNWWEEFGQFFLFDIDGTGTPNLIVFQLGWNELDIHSAYAFEDGALSQIELGDMRGGVWEFYMPPGDTGIIREWVAPGIQTYGFDWLELEDGTFRRRVSGRAEAGWPQTFYHIDGQEVSEDEFWSVFPHWSEWHDDRRSSGWRMTEENILNVVLDEAWRQAYADLLRELATVPDQWGMSPSRDFHLIDIDGTGTPNLIVIEHWAGGAAGIHSAYAFEGGVLSQIELGDGDVQRFSVHEFYMPPGDTGIVAQGFGFEFGEFLWLELEDGGFRQRVWGDLVYRGPEVGTVYRIDGQEVSVDEFNSVFHRGVVPDDRRSRGWRMTEENIQNVILGGWGANLW